MPFKSQKPCAQPGCTNLVDHNVRYCDDHAQHNGRSGGDNSHYNYRWKQLRARYLSRHPLCADCQQAGRLTPATEVHHVIPVAQGGSDRSENLLGLCKSCHSRRTRGGL
jgi:5-methylcytosine-specific restriction protein A